MKNKSSRRNFLKQSLLAFPAANTLSLLHASYLGDQRRHNDRSDQAATVARAKQNIDEIRKRATTIQLLDREGHPLAGLKVQIRQDSHEFLFGDNNWTMATMYRNGQIQSDRAKYYRRLFAGVLNSLNTTVYWTERRRNDATKTEDLQGDLRLDDFDESVNWANANGLTAKGHPLFWSIPKAIPEWLKKYDPDTMMKFVEVRIRNLCARYRGKVKAWDALNEALWEPAPKNLHRRSWPYAETVENLAEYISQVLKWAREEDPAALYAVNDYGISQTARKDLVDQNGEAVTTQRQRQRYLELVQRLGDAGYPPNLIGLQCHTGWLRPTEQVAFYDEMSATGIPLTITEFWARTKFLANPKILESEEWRTLTERTKGKQLTEEEAENIRDEYVLNYLTCAFGHPAIHSFYFWGFMNMAVDFKPSPSSSHTLRPIYNKVKQLIQEEWKTNLDLQTDRDGRVRFRGFCGDYVLSIMPKQDGTAIGYNFKIDNRQPENNYVLKTIL